MALALAGKQYWAASIWSAAGTNYVFGSGDEIVMVVWNDRPTQERVLLGGNVRQLDLWGRSTLIPRPMASKCSTSGRCRRSSRV